MSRRLSGTVKWYNITKGYGFIGLENGTDYFVHFSSLSMDGARKLEKGQRVEFKVEQNAKGLQAVDVALLTC